MYVANSNYSALPWRQSGTTYPEHKLGLTQNRMQSQGPFKTTAYTNSDTSSKFSRCVRKSYATCVLQWHTLTTGFPELQEGSKTSHRETDKPTTVTLAAHVRRGLINLFRGVVMLVVLMLSFAPLWSACAYFSFQICKWSFWCSLCDKFAWL